MKNQSQVQRDGNGSAAVSQTKTRQGGAAALPRKLPEDWAEQYIAKEFKVVALRECPLSKELHFCDTPDKAAEYWRLNIATNPYFNSECECAAVLILNTRHHVKGHQLISIGTMNTMLVHAREVFRGAIVASAAAVILMHNHPSGDVTPSYADIKVTHDLIRAGQLLKIEVLDHVIVGRPGQTGPGSSFSLFARGYFRAIDCFEGVNRKITKREVETILRRMCRIFKGWPQPTTQRRAA
jgi:proteasome lid subunit RPN8/RPN11